MANTDNKITGSGRGKSGDRMRWPPRSIGPKSDGLPQSRFRCQRCRPGTAPAATEPEKRGETGHTQHGQGEEKNPEPHVEPRGTGGQAVAAPLNYPYRTVGKLFFTQGGSGFSGSAAMITPNILLTAGHCVYSGGWSTNVAFYPSYGKRASNDRRISSTTTMWRPGLRGASIATGPSTMEWCGLIRRRETIIGWLGTLWNAPTAGRTWDAVGYPATPNPPFNGNVMDECVGSVASSSTSGTIGLTNDNMEHGSSGGPWITAWNETTRTHANGLQSFHIHDGDITEYGPYFTQDLKGLMDWISNPANRH